MYLTQHKLKTTTSAHSAARDQDAVKLLAHTVNQSSHVYVFMFVYATNRDTHHTNYWEANILIDSPELERGKAS